MSRDLWLLCTVAEVGGLKGQITSLPQEQEVYIYSWALEQLNLELFSTCP